VGELAPPVGELLAPADAVGVAVGGAGVALPPAVGDAVNAATVAVGDAIALVRVGTSAVTVSSAG
jgi:hypothetical protein